MLLAVAGCCVRRARWAEEQCVAVRRCDACVCVGGLPRERVGETTCALLGGAQLTAVGGPGALSGRQLRKHILEPPHGGGAGAERGQSQDPASRDEAHT